MLLDRGQLLAKRCNKIAGVGVSYKAGDAVHRLGRRRKTVRLPIIHHLKPMLDLSEIAISSRKRDRGSSLDPACLRQRLERVTGRWYAQRRVAPSEDELLGLGVEFDLANAAAAQLHV